MKKSTDSAPKNDLVLLMKWCNETFFNNELPPCPVKWNDRFQQKYGLFRCFGKVPREEYYPSIEISSMLQVNHHKCVETMAHEMIHHWQMEKYMETGNSYYLDRKRDRNLERSSVGHSTSFQMKMNEINAMGYGINVQIKSDSMESLRSQDRIDRKGFIVNWDHEGQEHFTIYFFKEISDSLDMVAINRLKDTYGELSIKDIYEIETNNQSICTGIKCLNGGGVRESSKKHYYVQSVIDEILNDESTVSYKSSNFKVSEVLENINEDVQRLGTFFKDNASLNLRLVLKGGLERVGIILTEEDVNDIIIGNDSKKINRETVNFIKDKWHGSDKKDVFKGRRFNLAMDSIYTSLRRDKSHIAKEELVKLLQNTGYSRCKDDIGKKLKQEMNKRYNKKGVDVSGAIGIIIEQINETEVAIRIITSNYSDNEVAYKKEVLADMEINGIKITPLLENLIENQVKHIESLKSLSHENEFLCS